MQKGVPIHNIYIVSKVNETNIKILNFILSEYDNESNRFNLQEKQILDTPQIFNRFRVQRCLVQL